MGERKCAINGVGAASKASGQDPIFYRMIIRFANDFNTLLLALYQDCWTQGQLPEGGFGSWESVPKERGEYEGPSAVEGQTSDFSSSSRSGERGVST